MSYKRWTSGASYIIFIDEVDGNIKAKNGTTGRIEFENADAATVFQAAIDALTNGGKICIKIGTYQLSFTLTLRNHIWLLGENMFKTILTPSQNIYTADPWSILDLSNCNYVRIEELELWGKGVDWARARGVGCQSGTAYYYTLIKRVLFYDFSIGIISGNGPLWIEGCRFNLIDNYTAGEGYAISLDGGLRGWVQDNQIEGGIHNGIRVNMQYAYIMNNHIDVSENDGIEIYSSNVWVMQNYVNAPVYKIFIDTGLSNVIVKHNLGYITKNSGTATITTGQTSTGNIAHGCELTPNIIKLTPTSDTGGKRFWASSKDATNFVITIDSSYSADITFDWEVEV